jgi:hypothetical protein
MNNKKGLINEIYIVIILFIVFLMLIGGFWLAATAGPLVVGEGKQLTGILRLNLKGDATNSSISNATTLAVTVATNTTDSFLGLIEFIVYLAFFSFLIGYIAVCFYVRTYKWLAIVWIGLIVAAVFISFIVSNSYQQAYVSSPDITSFYNAWGTNNFIMNYLPYIVGIFGILSGIVLFVIMSTDSEEETRFIQ